MAGSWKPLVNQPTFNASTMLLLTDGTVMCQDEGAAFLGSPNWWKLTPDPLGSYVNGTWTQLASGPVSPLYYASAVLRDGRVFRAGGEYNGVAQVDLLAAEIYDPLANVWTKIPVPAGWTNIGDAPCSVLPDGRVLLGSINDNRTAIYDPAANAWTAGGNKLNTRSSEETWTLLPDGTVLTAECFGHPQTEKFVIATNSWVTAGATKTDLVESSSFEIGPAILLPDGRVFAIGATGHTGLYTRPAVASQPGTWADGPSFPVQAGEQLIAKDAPAALLPNGRVLCAVSPAGGCPAVDQGYCPPTFFFEYDPATSTLTAVTPPPPNAGGAVFNGRMLLLPTGEVLFASGALDIEVYVPGGAPNPAWLPQITACDTSLQPGTTHVLSGTQLNGLSQAVSYGDDATMATNYPLVRIRNLGSNRVVYCRTHDHSTMGVATGSTVHSTKFTVPAGIEVGAAELTVVANGIASKPFAVSVGAQAPRASGWGVSWGSNRLDVFGLGQDAAMYHKAWDGSQWLPSLLDWQRLGGVFTSLPAVASWGVNRLDIFGLGQDRAMYHKAWNGSQWLPSLLDWERLGGVFTSPPAVISWGANRLDVFGLGQDRAMYHKAWNGSQWLPSLLDWERLGGVFTSPPAVASWGANRLDIFGLGQDRAMYHKAWNGSQWLPSPLDWERLGGVFTSPPAVASWGVNRLDIFGLGQDEAMYHKAWNGSQWLPSLLDWERLGGVFTAP